MIYKGYTLDAPKDTDYGVAALKDSPQFIRELLAYRFTRGKFAVSERKRLGIRIEDTGLLHPAQHMINCFHFFWKKEVQLYSCGIANNYSLDLIEMFCEEDDWGVAGAASTGKTFTIAGAIDVDWLCAPDFTSTYVASTSMDASEDRLWGKTLTLYRAAMRNIQEQFGKDAKIGNPIDYRRMIVFENIDTKDAERDYTNAIKAIAFPQGNEGKKAVETTRGRKNKRMRLFCDEYADMDLYVQDTRVNLGSNNDFIFGGMGNPANTINNPHTELCIPDDPAEWDSVTRYTRKWKTRTGVAMHLSGEDSPNFKAEGDVVPFPDLPTKAKEEAMLKRCHGNKNSLEYWRNFIGWWPDSSIEQTIISRSFIKSCELDFEPRWNGPRRNVCGFDTGFVAGGDRCAASFARFGQDDTGRNMGFYLGTREYLSSVGEAFEESIARKLVQDLIEFGIHPRDFGMDISGDGGKMMRAIIIEWSKFNPDAMLVFPISSMGRPSENRVSSLDRRSCRDAYDRLVTEYWFSIHTAFSTRSFVGFDLNAHKEVIDELCARTFRHKGKKVSIEKKDDMKKRIKKSPDKADSVVYTLCMLRRAGLEFNFAEETESLDVTEIRDWEERLIYKRGSEEAVVEEEYSYAGSSPDPDGF